MSIVYVCVWGGKYEIILRQYFSCYPCDLFDNSMACVVNKLKQVNTDQSKL